uniref:Uncharacterized protein AlNc14C117G6557 n=1 Tax=Albugo laibachii Nc14 TaxID=890382 RepID=F0WJ26_9STRA|nr:conserved hypothetical protein [Albugo laibachii Nc14]CCA21646.1 conserved hypothetical protein [Albugo laibachii Nc14]|eukprot:CCA21646.1 conserved hypothetical protein [Albugo laibachii Nc14]
MDAAAVWLRLELFELGLLHVPIKSTSISTLCDVTKALDCLTGCHNDDQDVNMTPESEDSKGDNAQPQAINFSTWKSVVKEHLEWPEKDYTAFWLLLVYFHRNIPAWEATEKVVLTEERCLSVEVVPTHRITMFLFVQASRFQASKTKATLDSFNTKWCRDFSSVGLDKTSTTQSPSGGASPVLLSPHTKAMQDRATLDDYYLSFVRNNLEILFQLIFPRLEMKSESENHIHTDQVDQLGFLISFGAGKYEPLSKAYRLWRTDTHGNKVENPYRVCEFLKSSMGLNTNLYPAVDFSLVENVSLYRVAPNDSCIYHQPIVISNVSKSTIIRHLDASSEDWNESDLVIHACHDTYIYILGCIRHVFVIACSNCKIITAPNRGVYSMDRCDNVYFTIASGLVRVSNCLDVTINAYTLAPIIMTGENLGIVLGPHNTKYPTQKCNIEARRLINNPSSSGEWSRFINLESEQDNVPDTENSGNFAKPAITLQNPHDFLVVTIPIIANELKLEFPFPLPIKFREALSNQVEEVEKFRKMICDEEFDTATKRSLEHVIQNRFKEWLSATGNARQILDLVHIEKTKS